MRLSHDYGTARYGNRGHLDSQRKSGLEGVCDMLIVGGMGCFGREGACQSSVGLYVSQEVSGRAAAAARHDIPRLPSRLQQVLVLCHQHAVSCTPHASCTRGIYAADEQTWKDFAVASLLRWWYAEDEYDDNSPRSSKMHMYSIPANRASRARLIVLAHATR